MTSGRVHPLPVDSIIVNRPERQRRNLDGIDDLADSIRRTGLINPIVVTEDLVLVAGERRLTACKQLGWTSILCHYAEDLDPLALQLIELEENTRRVDLDWKDQCEAVAKYHRLRREMEPDWTLTATGDALGLTESSVRQYLSVHDEIESGNAAVQAAPKFSVARGITQRKREREKASALADIAPAPSVSKREAPILNEDFTKWSKSSRVKYNFIHCDFPYGINADKHDQGNAAARGGYTDDFDTYRNLLASFGDNLDNFCAESAHLIFWFSMDHYEFTRTTLVDMGWRVFPHPLVWFKSDNSGILPDPSRQPRRNYETAFFASRGDRKLVGAVSNITAAPNVKSIHMSEKPVAMLGHFFRLCVDEYSMVLDPTCGSGNALKAAKAAGAKHVLGLEINPEFAKQAQEAWDD